MKSYFFTNTIWYLILAIITVIVFIFNLYKSKNRKLFIALFLFVSGTTFSIEVIVYCFLRGYDYHPMILPHSPIDDGLAGNLFSQFSITTTALFIVIFNLKFYWRFIIACTYGIIEELFLKLGIYSHNWYKTWMTVVGFLILFWIVKKMSGSKYIYSKGIVHTIFMFFGLYTLHMILVWWPLLLWGIVKINLNIFPDPMISYTFFSFLNLLILSVTCMLTYRQVIKGWGKVIAVLGLYGTFYLAVKLDILHFDKGLFLATVTGDILGMYLFIFLIDKLINKIKMELKNL